MRSPEPRFLLAFAFLVWSLLPHFRMVAHTHAHSDGHDHASLTPSEIRLADQVARALPAEGDAGEFGGESRDARGRPASPEGDWSRAEAQTAHVHYQEDLNLAALLLHALPPVTGPPCAKTVRTSYRAPALGAPVTLPARGPPALPSA